MYIIYFLNVQVTLKIIIYNRVIYFHRDFKFFITLEKKKMHFLKPELAEGHCKKEM